MSWADFYLLCLAVGALWSLASLLLGGMHLGGHAPHAHGALHAGSAHPGGPLHAGGAHHAGASGAKGMLRNASWMGSMLNPSCVAVFLAWFGGVGYLLTRHSGLSFWIDLLFAVGLGVVGASLLAGFLRFLQSRDQPLDAADYQMIGVLGEVSCAIRPDGVGEVIYVRDGARKLTPARSETHQQIERGEEVVVTRYEEGIAYVRTWAAMLELRNVPAPPSDR